MHPAQVSEEELLNDCVVRVQRRGGPGGQHRNKVETAVVIEHKPTGVRAEASERRSQADNRRVAILRLRMVLALEHREPLSHRDPSEPNAAELVSPLWQSRMAGNRIDVSNEHGDFPAIIAELLDALFVYAFDMSKASQHFAVTGSQLVNLLRSHPPALTLVNAMRIELGLHRLR